MPGAILLIALGILHAVATLIFVSRPTYNVSR